MQRAEFEHLVHAWYDRLYRFAFSLVRNGDDALDLVQQTFARWAEKGHQLRDARRAKTWLFTVLYREFVAHWRQRRRQADEPAEDVLDRSAVVPPTARVSADAQLVLDALARLDETFRAPLTLFYLQDHSYREIAEILDVPIGTVMSRLARGRDHLRALVEKPPAQTSASADDSKIIPLPRTKGAHHG